MSGLNIFILCFGFGIILLDIYFAFEKYIRQIPFKRLGIYMLRWQLSTPILAPIVSYFSTGTFSFGTLNSWVGSIVANIVGSLIFFNVDRFIFTSEKLGSVWHVKENIVCVDCGKNAPRGYRLVKSINYDRTKGLSEYRCEYCSIQKADKLKLNGIELYK